MSRAKRKEIQKRKYVSKDQKIDAVINVEGVTLTAKAVIALLDAAEKEENFQCAFAPTAGITLLKIPRAAALLYFQHLLPNIYDEETCRKAADSLPQSKMVILEFE